LIKERRNKMKKVIILMLLSLIFMSCSDRVVTYNKNAIYAEAYPQGVLMWPAVGGVNYYIARSDLIVYGKADAITGPVTYTSADSKEINRDGKVVKFRVDEVLYSASTLKTEVKKDEYIDWFVICSKKDYNNCDYEVYEGEKYILFLKQKFSRDRTFTPLDGAFGRISEATQKQGNHYVFSNKSIEEIKSEVILGISKIKSSSEIIVKKYLISYNEIEPYMQSPDGGNGFSMWRNYMTWDEVPDFVKNKLDDVYDGVVGFCQKDASLYGHFELYNSLWIDEYFYVIVDSLLDYGWEGCTIFAIKNLPKDIKAVSSSIR
jgi:hypothetical protein